MIILAPRKNRKEVLAILQLVMRVLEETYQIVSRAIQEILGETVLVVLGILVIVVIAEEEAVVVSEAVTGVRSKQGFGMYAGGILI